MVWSCVAGLARALSQGCWLFTVRPAIGRTGRSGTPTGGLRSQPHMSHYPEYNEAKALEHLARLKAQGVTFQSENPRDTGLRQFWAAFHCLDAETAYEKYGVDNRRYGRLRVAYLERLVRLVLEEGEGQDQMCKSWPQRAQY